MLQKAKRKTGHYIFGERSTLELGLELEIFGFRGFRIDPRGCIKGVTGSFFALFASGCFFLLLLRYHSAVSSVVWHTCARSWIERCGILCQSVNPGFTDVRVYMYIQSHQLPIRSTMVTSQECFLTCSNIRLSTPYLLRYITLQHDGLSPETSSTLASTPDLCRAHPPRC